MPNVAVEGKFTVESQTGRFIVHAAYGYRPGRRAIVDLRPGTEFVAPPPADPTAPSTTWRLRTMSEDGADAVDRATRTKATFALDLVVDVPGIEDFDDGDDLGALWRRTEHPTFADEDLDDLVKVLADYRKFKEGKKT